MLNPPLDDLSIGQLSRGMYEYIHVREMSVEVRPATSAEVSKFPNKYRARNSLGIQKGERS